MNDSAETLLLEDFWGQRHLQKLLKDALNECPESANQIVKHAEAIPLPKEYIPELRGVERLRAKKGNAQKKLNSPHRMCGLLFSTFDFLVRAQDRTPSQEACLDSLKNAIQQLCMRMPSAFVGRKLYGHLIDVNVFPNIKIVIKTISNEFGIDENDFVSAAQYFFPDFDLTDLPDLPRKIYFNTYRFHASPGQVVKTFTVVESPTKKVPACLFYNFFVSTDPRFPRRASGLVIPTSKAIYFSGGLANGSGMKFMALEKQLQTVAPPEHIRGLMVTFDEDEVIVSARFVMIRTDAENHRDAGAGIFPVQKLAEAKPFLNEMRNRVKFSLERSVYLGNQRVDQERIVEETRRALESENKPRLRYADKQPFNPAADSDYTFNSALRIWNLRE